MRLYVAVFLLFGVPMILWTMFCFRWNIYALIIFLVGRAHGCPLSVALVTIGRAKSHDRNRDLIEAKSFSVTTDDSFDLWQTPAGQYWCPPGPNSLGPLADELAEQGDGIYGGERYGVRHSNVVIDCGASVGVFTKEALDRGASRVIAVEPSPQNARCLRRNLQNEIAAGKVIVRRGCGTKMTFYR